MSVDFVETFQGVVDNGGLLARHPEWTNIDGDVVTSGGRYRGGYFEQGVGTVNDEFLTFTNPNNFERYNRISYWFKSDLSGSGLMFLSVNVATLGSDITSGNKHCQLQLNSSGSVSLWRAGKVFLSSSADVFTAGRWHWVEIQLDIDNSGSFKMYVDGAVILEYTATDFGVGTSYSTLCFITEDPTVSSYDEMTITSSTTGMPDVLGEEVFGRPVHSLMSNQIGVLPKGYMTLLIPSSNITEPITDFLVMVDLSIASDEFWEVGTPDGEDLVVSDGVNEFTYFLWDWV